MKKFVKLLLLLSLSSVMLFSGCRRKPIEQTEAITEKETETETASETETETESATEKETKKAKQSKKQKEQTEKSEKSQKTEKAETADQTENQKKQKETNKKTVAPSNPATSGANNGLEPGMCPYCWGIFSTEAYGDGSSEYSEHVAAEEAYIQYMKSQGYYDVPDIVPGSGSANTPNTNNPTSAQAQCTYCWGWFSTDSTYGSSEYSQHMAMEEANAYQEQVPDGYYQACPYCGLYIDPVSLQDHVTYGY